MHKVVVERPRWNPGPGKRVRRANLPDELLPKFEGIKRPHLWRKGLTDLLGPLKRWLQSQVGRPWNDVYSEACAVIKPDSVIRAHIKTHLLEFVERHTFMHQGKVCVLVTGFRGSGITPVDELLYGRSHFYVHPETALLEATKQSPRRKQLGTGMRARGADFRWVSEQMALYQCNGLWFALHFRAVPGEGPFKAYDHLAGEFVGRGGLVRRNGVYLLCLAKQQLSRREWRRYQLRNGSASDPTGAQSSGCGQRTLKTALGFLAGRRLWVLLDPAISVQIRSVACDGGATLSTPGNSTVDFLSAAFSWPRASTFCGPKNVGYHRN